MDKLTINRLKEPKEEYGGNTTIDQLLEFVQPSKRYVCPRCKGDGFITIKYDPDFCIDSFTNPHWNLAHDDFHDWRYKNRSCTLCNGKGYTEEEYKS